MPSPWNFGDTIERVVGGRRDQKLTLYQIAQQQQQMNALREIQRQQLELQQAAQAQTARYQDASLDLARQGQEQDMLSATRDYNLSVAQNFVRDPGYTGPAAGSLATPQGQAPAELGVGDPSRMNRAMGPDLISKAQYAVNEQQREFQRGQEMMNVPAHLRPYYGANEVTREDFQAGLTPYTSAYQATTYANAAKGGTASQGGLSGAVVRLGEIDQAIANLSATDDPYELQQERGRILASLTPAELTMYRLIEQARQQEQSEAPETQQGGLSGYAQRVLAPLAEQAEQQRVAQEELLSLQQDIRRMLDRGASEESEPVQQLRARQDALGRIIASSHNPEGIGTMGGIYKRSASEYFLEPANLFGYEMPFTPVAFDIATGVVPGYALAKMYGKAAPLATGLGNTARSTASSMPGAVPISPTTRALPPGGAWASGAGRAQGAIPARTTRLTPTQIQKIEEVAQRLGVSFEEAARRLGITP